MINYYVCVAGIILGFLLLIFGVRKHLKYTRSKEISSFKLIQESNSITLNAGKYSIEILGAGEINSFPLRIINEGSQQKIDLYKFGIPYRRFKKGIMAVTHYYFEVKEAGNYLFVFKDLDKISVTQFAPTLLSGLKSYINPRSLSLIIKNYASPLSYGLSIIMINLGAGLIFIAILYYLNLLGILVPGK